jgi:putative membrane protein
MKKLVWLYLILPLGFMACNNQGKDSVAEADSANEAKSDSPISYSDTNSHKGMLGVDEATSSFMVDVADIGMTEIQLGRLAEEKALSQRVKDFGAMMVRDHSKANEELKDLASGKNVTLPSTVSEDHQKKIDDLQAKTGKDFDKAYIDMMEDGHESAIRDFEKNTDNKDADVRTFVDKTLPTLRMHFDSAKAIKKALRY